MVEIRMDHVIRDIDTMEEHERLIAEFRNFRVTQCVDALRATGLTWRRRTIRGQ